MVNIGGTESGAAGINDSGQVAAGAYVPAPPIAGTRAFLYSGYPGGTWTELPNLGGGIGYANAINSSGQIAGTSYVSDADGGVEHAFLFGNGVVTDLGTLGGPRLSAATGINDRGDVVGLSLLTGNNSNSSFAGAHAFLYAAGGSMLDLRTLGGSTSRANAISSYGEIVGESLTGTGADHAFLYANGAMIDLNTLLPPNSGWVLEAANAINDSGQIVGYGINPNGQTHGFLLNTAPEPGSFVLLFTGSAILVVNRRTTLAYLCTRKQ